MGNRNLLIYLYLVVFTLLCFFGVFKLSEWISYIINESNNSNKNDILLINGHVEKRFNDYQIILNNVKKLN